MIRKIGLEASNKLYRALFASRLRYAIINKTNYFSLLL